jgi:4-azaleucine resistance transporter AzlC
MSATEPSDPGSAAFTRAGTLTGIRDMAGLALFVLPFGLAFGAAAIERGLSATTSLLMSGIVFAGAAQFAALEFWAAPLPLVPLLLAVFAVNARHILLGASLYPWLAAQPPLRRYGALLLMTDANWAYATSALAREQRDLGLLVGSGVALWAAWLLGTALGVIFGTSMGDLGRFGFDVLMVAYFTAVVVGMWKGRADLLPWLAAAVGAALAWRWLPPGWHVLVGALAGGLVGAWRYRPAAAAGEPDHG